MSMIVSKDQWVKMQSLDSELDVAQSTPKAENVLKGRLGCSYNSGEYRCVAVSSRPSPTYTIFKCHSIYVHGLQFLLKVK